MSAVDPRPELLLIDDVPANLHFLASALQAEYRIRIASSGEEGLRRTRQTPAPDLVLLDVSLPDMSGHDVLRALRGDPATREVPVIFVTADASEQGELTGLELGADDFVSKPIVLPVLRARIRTILQREALKREMLRLGLQRAEQELDDAQQQMQRLRAELEQRDRLDALGKLVARFAHDIGNPIGNSLVAGTAIEQALREARQRYEAGTLSKSVLQTLFDTGGEGIGMVLRNLARARELLESFKQQALDQATAQQREIQLKPWLEDLSYQLTPMLAAAGHRLQIEVQPGLQLATQPGPLGQVISNLVSNALLHAFEGRSGGAVCIHAESLPGPGVRLSVSDDGVGMPAEVLARAFEPFFTTKAGRGGTGLGLDIVKHTIEQTLGGQLQVESTPGQGTRFRIDLPGSD